MKKSLIILIVIIAVVGLSLVSMYNSLVKGDQAVTAQWAQVDNQLQRRFDLIPNLVESTQAVLTQEQTVFGQLAEARSKYAGAATVNEKAQAATQVEGALARLLVIMENYPQLKSNETVQQLMAQLEGSENRISVERGRYNEEVKTFNTKVKTFPTNAFAGMFGFSAKEFFQVEAAAKTAPKVDLNIKK